MYRTTSHVGSFKEPAAEDARHAFTAGSLAALVELLQSRAEIGDAVCGDFLEALHAKTEARLKELTQARKSL